MIKLHLHQNRAPLDHTYISKYTDTVLGDTQTTNKAGKDTFYISKDRQPHQKNLPDLQPDALKPLKLLAVDTLWYSNDVHLKTLTALHNRALAAKRRPTKTNRKLRTYDRTMQLLVERTQD